jgi:hypothetical protein
MANVGHNVEPEATIRGNGLIQGRIEQRTEWFKVWTFPSGT